MWVLYLLNFLTIYAVFTHLCLYISFLDHKLTGGRIFIEKSRSRPSCAPLVHEIYVLAKFINETMHFIWRSRGSKHVGWERENKNEVKWNNVFSSNPTFIISSKVDFSFILVRAFRPKKWYCDSFIEKKYFVQVPFLL